MFQTCGIGTKYKYQAFFANLSGLIIIDEYFKLSDLLIYHIKFPLTFLCDN